MGIKEEAKKYWNWLWNSDSWVSYIVFLVLVFVLIKFIFLPFLAFAFHSELPMAIVESSSMDHAYLRYCASYDSRGECLGYSADYSLCGNSLDKYDSLNFNEYWNKCGAWYESKNISKEQMNHFSFHNGFKKGDILIIIGWKKPKLGDVLLFKPNSESLSPRSVIHRIIAENPLQTKGDHNEQQLIAANNIYHTDETSITEDRVIGVAVLRIPYLGWLKLWVVDFFNKIF